MAFATILFDPGMLGCGVASCVVERTRWGIFTLPAPAEKLILDEVGVIIRDKDGGILQREGLQSVRSADDNVWRKALDKKKAVRGKAVFAGDNDYYGRRHAGGSTEQPEARDR